MQAKNTQLDQKIIQTCQGLSGAYLYLSTSHKPDTKYRNVMIKLRSTLGKFREFWALIAYILLAWVRHNHFVNTNFSKLSKEISDPNHKILSYIINNRVINLKVFKFDDKDLWDWEITFHIVAERRAAREERCLSSVRLLLNMCHLIGRHRVIVVAVLNHQVGLKLTVLQ